MAACLDGGVETVDAVGLVVGQDERGSADGGGCGEVDGGEAVAAAVTSSGFRRGTGCRLGAFWDFRLRAPDPTAGGANTGW